MLLCQTNAYVNMQISPANATKLKNEQPSKLSMAAFRYLSDPMCKGSTREIPQTRLDPWSWRAEKPLFPGKTQVGK